MLGVFERDVFEREYRGKKQILDLCVIIQILRLEVLVTSQLHKQQSQPS